MNREIVKKKCIDCEKMRRIEHFSLNKYSEESDGRLKACMECADIKMAVFRQLMCGK